MVAELIPFAFPKLGTYHVRTANGGVQVEFQFPNGYGASVINDGYGKRQGLFELAPLDAAGNIIHLSDVTGEHDEVIGFLTGDEVCELLTALCERP